MITNIFSLLGVCTIPQLHFTWRKCNRIKEKRFVFPFSFFRLKTKNEKRFVFPFLFFNLKKRKSKTESFFVLSLTSFIYPIAWTEKTHFACMFPQFNFLSGKKNYRRKKKRVVFPLTYSLYFLFESTKEKRLDFRFLSTEDLIANVSNKKNPCITP